MKAPNQALDRMTRSAVSCMFQFGRPRRAPRHRSACRWVFMRALPLLLLVCLLVPVAALGAGTTNELSLLKYQGRRQAYEWRISEARIAATPKWNIDAGKIPVAPDRAWQIAKEWFKKQGKSRPDLLRLEIVPFVRDTDLSADRKRQLKDLLGRYYYRVECVPAAFDSMVVAVLMDRSVLEPFPIANLPPEEIK
jgi:hypothetical protein